MKKTKRYLVFFIISFLLHIIFGVLAYILIDKIEKINPNDDKKVKLSFKRGGDIAKKDSTLKENTPITNPKTATQPSPQQQQIPPSPQTKDINANDVVSPKKPSHSSYDLSNLKLFNPLDTANEAATMQDTKLASVARKLQSLPRDLQNEIKQLYGDELGDYGDAEQDFIINNLREIGHITQYHLSRRGYPPDAGYLGQQGTNAVEFYLYPNGDISDLKIIQETQSMILDKNTITVIQIAYKDYPRPTTKTKIKIYVKYYLQY